MHQVGEQEKGGGFPCRTGQCQSKRKMMMAAATPQPIVPCWEESPEGFVVGPCVPSSGSQVDSKSLPFWPSVSSFFA